MLTRWSRTPPPSTNKRSDWRAGRVFWGRYGVVEGEVEEGVETVGLVLTCVSCVSVKDFADCVTVCDVIHHLSVKVGD